MALALPESRFSQAYLDACLQLDTEGFLRFSREKDIPYAMDEAYRYLRTLHRRELSAFLKRERSVSYFEYLVVEGLVKVKPAEYWKEALLAWIRENCEECSGGVLDHAHPSYEYDPFRHVCSLSVPVYSGCEPVTCLGVSDGKPVLLPFWNDGNLSCDVLLRSGKDTVGCLNRTQFRSRGVGTALFSALHSGAATVQALKVHQHEFTTVVITLHFSC